METTIETLTTNPRARTAIRSRASRPRCPYCGRFVPQWTPDALAHGEGGDYACERCADERC